MLPCLPSAPLLLRHSALKCCPVCLPPLFATALCPKAALLSVPFLQKQKCPSCLAVVRSLSAKAEMPQLPCCCPFPFCKSRNAPIALFLLAFRSHKIGSLPMAVPAPATHPHNIGSLPMAVPAPAFHSLFWLSAHGWLCSCLPSVPCCGSLPFPAPDGAVLVKCAAQPIILLVSCCCRVSCWLCPDGCVVLLSCA